MTPVFPYAFGLLLSNLLYGMPQKMWGMRWFFFAVAVEDGLAHSGKGRFGVRLTKPNFN